MESLLSLLKSEWFLKKLYQNDLPFELKHQRLLKDVMIVEAEDYGYCTCENWMESRHGWSVGSRWSAGPVFFALNMNAIDGRICIKREAIAQDILISIRGNHYRPNKSMQPTR